MKERLPLPPPAIVGYADALNGRPLRGERAQATAPRSDAGTVARPLARDIFGREITPPEPQPTAQPEQEPGGAIGGQRREAATESIGRRAGALSDELDFPEFVASLVHGTFDAIVDSSIRQMESFADLVAAVAKPLDQFTQENVTPNQARDWLVEQHPRELAMIRGDGAFQVVPRTIAGEGLEEGEPPSPDWLADFGLQGEPLTPELIEEELLPKARERVARNRLQTLATMVLLGMNRVVVRDGTIAARLRFRAAAADHARVDYAVSDDPGSGGTEWGERGSRSYAAPTTKVSTVGVNVQADSELKAELFGEVKINFASETVPLERFVDEAKRTLLERHARSAPALLRQAAPVPPATAQPPAPAVPGVPPAPSPTVAPPAEPQPTPPPGGTR
ncbi:MAG: hypothetical protein ACYCYR_12585 [Desulfobulbaceae bacterium]